MSKNKKRNLFVGGEPIDLYSAAEVKSVREYLTLEQSNLCALTGLPIDPKQHCLDHSHKDMFVRAVLSRQANAMLGKFENAYTRYLSYWYPYSLSDFLRQSANYLDKCEKNKDTRWFHPGWIKKVKTEFNKLNENQKKQVLVIFGKPEGKNGVERKKLFAECIDKINTFESLMMVINSVKIKDES